MGTAGQVTVRRLAVMLSMLAWLVAVGVLAGGLVAHELATQLAYNFEDIPN